MCSLSGRSLPPQRICIVSSTDFLCRLRKVAPIRIQKILTDNGSQFTDHFTAKGKRATGEHAFDVGCDEAGIVHRLSPPRHPQTNGMVESFNGCVSDLVKQTRFASAAELEPTLTLYLKHLQPPYPAAGFEAANTYSSFAEMARRKT
jgi:transposase InsO family protein